MVKKKKHFACRSGSIKYNENFNKDEREFLEESLVSRVFWSTHRSVA